MMESRDQAGVTTGPVYHGDNPSHYAHSQYPYPPTSAPFSMNHDINLDQFSTGVQTSAQNSLSEPSSSHIGSSHTLSAHANVAALTTPGMAPPQSGGPQPYSPPGPRVSIDEELDITPAGGDPRRKRSKVSRACDECRRKKVRCDAAADDGSTKTCSNCQRAGLICGYNRVPMKRGPSKGYIKELSERVQQVESQMALSTSAGLPGFRQSLDGNTAIYPDPLYSPDDQSAFKRNFSFSDQRSPFATSDFNRDRIPSLGGWASSPQASAFRGRDRGSLAIAPDQQPPVNNIPLLRPFWISDTDGQPPRKRQKLDNPVVGPPDLGHTTLNKYYQEVHANLPILPDADSVMTIVRKAEPQIQHAFCAAVQFVPSADGESMSDATPIGSSSHFKSYDDLAEFIYDTAREDPDTRSRENNLVYVWVQLIMIASTENDLGRLRGGRLPKSILIKQAVELCWHCIHKDQRLPPDLDTRDCDLYREHLARAWYCTEAQARFHALAVGLTNPTPTGRQSHLPRLPNVFVAPHTFLSLSAVGLQTVLPLLQNRLPANLELHSVQLALRDNVLTSLDIALHSSSLDPVSQSIADQIQLFFELLLSRYTDTFHPFNVLRNAIALTECLCKPSNNPGGRYSYSPLNVHLFSLLTITLLEFTSDGVARSLRKVAADGIQKLKTRLEQFADRTDGEGQQQENNPAENAASEEKYRTIHWADALLSMVSRRVSTMSAGDATNGNGDGDGPGADGAESNEHSAAVDFALLLRHGYLTILAESAGV